MGDAWLVHYKSDTFKMEIEALWAEVEGLYVDLHAYVRHRLSSVYSQVTEDGPIPAHLLGRHHTIALEIYTHKNSKCET
jgi:peptidyl-dipeptidase A